MVAAGFRFRKIKSSHTFGEKLKRARKRLGVDLIEAELSTNVRAKYLNALENEDFNLLPSDVYVKGFIVNYAKFLGIDPGEAFALYTRHKIVKKKGEGELSPIKMAKIRTFVITPKVILMILGVILSISTVSYIFFGVYNFSTVPELEIFSPDNNSVTFDEFVKIEGKTNSGSDLFINKQQISIAESGDFEMDFSLQNGINTIVVTSDGRNNRSSSKVIIIEKKVKTATREL